MSSFELGRDVSGISVIEEDDTDGFDDAVGLIDPVADVVGLTGGSEAGARCLGFVEALKP